MKRHISYETLQHAAKLGEMLGSSFDGEVMNAAHRLNAFLRSEKLTFTELLSNVVVEKVVVREVPKYRDRPFSFYKKLAVKIRTHPRYEEDVPQKSFIENMLNPATTHYHGKQQTWILDIATKQLGIDTEAE